MSLVNLLDQIQGRLLSNIMIRVLAYFIPLKSLNIKDYETATITKVIYSYETSH